MYEENKQGREQAFLIHVISQRSLHSNIALRPLKRDTALTLRHPDSSKGVGIKPTAHTQWQVSIHTNSLLEAGTIS